MNKTIKVLITVIAIILVLTGVSLAYLYIKTDTFKKDDELFFKYVDTIMQDFKEVVKDSNIDNYLDRKLNNTYENSGEVEIAIKTTGTPENIDIDSMIINFNGKKDNINNKEQEDFNINYSDNVTLPVSYVRNDNKYGISSNEIMRAYAVVENNNLREFFNKLGVDGQNIPNEIKEFNSFNLLDTNELEILQQRYTTIIKDNLSSGDFSKDVNQGKKGYKLTISREKLQTIVSKILIEMKNDEIIREKVQSASIIGKNTVSAYENKIDELLDRVENWDKNEKQLVITVYETVNGTTSLEISFDRYVAKIDISQLNAVVTFNEDGKALFNIDVKKESGEKSVKYTLNMNAKNELIANENSESLVNAEYEILGMDEDIINEKCTIIINKTNANELTAIGMEYKKKIEFKEITDIVELTDSNSVTLNDLSRDTLVETMQQLLGRIAELHVSKTEQAEQNSESIVSKLVEFIQIQTRKVEDTFNNISDQENIANELNNETE